MTKILVLGSSLRRGRRLIHPGRYTVPSKAMDERTAEDAVKRGLGCFQPVPERVPPRIYAPVEDAADKKPKGRRRKGPAPENKALDGADETGAALD